MNVSNLINVLEAFMDKHGDVEIQTKYWCDNCQEYHEGEGVRFELTRDNKAVMEI